MKRRRCPLLLSLLLALAALPPAPAHAQDADHVIAPELLAAPEPTYPPAARDAEVQADVVVEIELDATGAVIDVLPLSLTIYTWAEDGSVLEQVVLLEDDTWGFAEAAVEAVGAYAFAPAGLIDDAGVVEAIPVRLMWQVGFFIDVAAPEEPPDGSFEGPLALTGELVERGTRTPLAGFLVQATSVDDPALSRSTVTDDDGGFAFSGLAEGGWIIAVDEAGYAPVRAEESIVAGQVTEVRYFVERARYDEYVSRTVGEAFRREVTRRDVGMQEIQRAPGTSNDALRVVLNLPGVARAAYDFGEVIMRGSETADNRYVLDGMPLPQLFHMAGLRAVVPTELLGELEVYPGGFGVAYGDATGGVIDARTRDPRDDRVGGHVDVNLYDAGVFLEGPISDRLGFQLGVRRSYADAILGAMDIPDLQFTSVPRYYDGQAGLHYEIDGHHALSVLALASDDRIGLVDSDETDIPPEQRGGFDGAMWFNGVQLHLDSRYADGRVVRTTGLQLLRIGLDFAIGDRRWVQDAITVNLTDETRWTPSERVELLAGFEANYEDWSWDIRVPRPDEGDVNEDFFDPTTPGDASSQPYADPAVYTALTVFPVQRWSLTPGLRLEYFTVQDELAIDPRIATRLDVLDSWALTASVGRYHRDFENYEISEGIGNPDLRLESAIHTTVGTEHALTDAITLSVEGFYKDLEGLTSPSDRLVERDGELVSENLNNGGDGRAYGMEVFLRHQPAHHFFGWVSYTLSRSERRDFGSDAWRVFDYDETHILTVLGSYQLPRNWSVGGRFRYVTGRPTTDLSGGAFDSDSNIFVGVPEETNSRRLPDFVQLDLRIDKRWVYDAWSLTGYLDVQNVTNRRNTEDYVYAYDYGVRESISGFPIFPVFGLRGEF